MPDTINNPPEHIDSSIQPKYRKPLNAQQILVLHMLYIFRFGTSDHLAWRLGKTSSKSVQKRLKILEDQDFIAKHYDKSYKLQGKPAAYYLVPKGARVLQELETLGPNRPINIKRIYRDKIASPGFINHSLNVFTALNQLRAVYGSAVYPVSKTAMSYEAYSYFIHPLPDAFVSLQSENDVERRFFFDIFEESVPYFVQLRRVKAYFQYASEGDWHAAASSSVPVILMACANKSIQKRLRKRIAKELSESYESLTFATALLSDVLTATSREGKIWLPVSSHGDDPYEPTKPVRLQHF